MTTTESRSTAEPDLLDTRADRGRQTGGLGAVAGLAAAGVALALGEVFSDMSEKVPSLVLSAGEWFIDVVPGDLAKDAIEIFGENDKIALTIGVIVITMGIAAATGRAALGRRRIGDAVFVAFTLVGGWLVARDPLSADGLSWAAAIAAGVAGWLTLRFLLARAEGRLLVPARRAGATGRPARSAIESPVDPRATRRAFFGYAGAAGAFAATAVGAGRALRGESAAQRIRTEVAANGAVTSSPESELASTLTSLDDLDSIEGLASYVTSSEGNNFYKIDTSLISPQVDPRSWRLDITGMVDTPYTLAYDDILGMDLIERVVTLSCVSNEIGGDLVGNAVWTGVPLADILDRAGVQPGAEQVMGRSVDDFTAGFPVEAAYDGRSALLVVGMNGEPLPIRHGFPVRLVIAGLYGYVSAVKWLREIKLTTFDEEGFWIPRGWSQMAPMKTTSRIDVPRRGDDLVAGPVAVAGVAWAPNRGIAEVQVRIDGGEWRPARLAGSVSEETWVQWVYEWDATSGDHELQVRTIDGDGNVQPEGPRAPAPNGAEGWHRRTVAVA